MIQYPGLLFVGSLLALLLSLWRFGGQSKMYMVAFLIFGNIMAFALALIWRNNGCLL